MKILGNIVTDNKKISGFDSSFNIVNDYSEIIENIPTLIIGYKKTQSIFPNFSVLDWQIKTNVYWTYGRRERGEKYIENIEKFKNLTLNYFIKSINYQCFNILTENHENKKKFIEFLKNNEKKTILMLNDMVYISCNCNKIIGFSLRDIDYIGGNKKKIYSFLYSHNNIILDNKKVLFSDNYLKVKNKPYLLTCLF